MWGFDLEGSFRWLVSRILKEQTAPPFLTSPLVLPFKWKLECVKTLPVLATLLILASRACLWILAGFLGFFWSGVCRVPHCFPLLSFAQMLLPPKSGADCDLFLFTCVLGAVRSPRFALDVICGCLVLLVLSVLWRASGKFKKIKQKKLCSLLSCQNFSIWL